MEKALILMVVRKIRKGKDIDTISYELDEDKNKIAIIYYTALDFAPGYDIDQIYNALKLYCKMLYIYFKYTKALYIIALFVYKNIKHKVIYKSLIIKIW